MEFIQNLKSKNIISHVLHALFNAGFALLIFLSIYIGGQIEVALLLVAISKWRILAVRSRYWGVNLLANLVDITVGFSMVGLMYFATDIKEGGLWVQAGLAILYAIWLIVIKPLSGRRAAKIQAGTGLFLGIWCIMATAHVMWLRRARLGCCLGTASHVKPC